MLDWTENPDGLELLGFLSREKLDGDRVAGLDSGVGGIGALVKSVKPVIFSMEPFAAGFKVPWLMRARRDSFLLGCMEVLGSRLPFESSYAIGDGLIRCT